MLTDAKFAHYIEVVLAGDHPREMVPELQQLLDRSPERHAEIAELLALFQQDSSSEMVEPVTQPAFNLAFLQQPPRPQPSIPNLVAAAFAAGKDWAWDSMGMLWYHFENRNSAAAERGERRWWSGDAVEPSGQ